MLSEKPYSADRPYSTEKPYMEFIYPTFRFVIFCCSSLFFTFILLLSFSSTLVYDQIEKVKKEHYPALYESVLFSLTVLLIIDAFTILILFLTCKLCKVPLTKKTMIWLIAIHLSLLFFFTVNALFQ